MSNYEEWIKWKKERKTLAQIKEEAAKCDVVCANCHCERTWGDKS